MTTRSRATAAVAVLFIVAMLAAVLTRHPSRRHRDAVVAYAPAARTEVVDIATAFVTALDDVDQTHPHGNPQLLRRVTDPALLQQLATTSPLTFAQLQTAARQHATVTAVAVQVTGDRAVALVTAELTVTRDGTPPLRTAVSYTLTLRRSNAQWLVVGAAT